MTGKISDWRLLNYNGYLDGKEFELKDFKTEGTNDHEHCLLCWKKITDLSIDNVVSSGYCFFDKQTKQINWICEECFMDFKIDLGWKTKK